MSVRPTAPGTLRMRPGSAEPAVTAWEPVSAADLLAAVTGRGPGPRVIAVDGRSGAGKSTLASLLAAATPRAAVVSTDDVAWNHSMFDWAEDFRSSIIGPVRAGLAVDYRPPGWVAHRRPGSVRVEPARSLLVVEGVGSSQRAMRELIDAAIWVQSDAAVARDLGIARDTASGVNGDHHQAIAFWDEWMAAEDPFLEREAPWSQAAAIVAGVRPGLDQPILWRAAMP